MSRIKNLRKRIREHARIAKMLLPPTPRGCPPYTRFYFESYKGQLFQACTNSRHRHCPKTSDQGHVHRYCLCPCHRTDLSRHAKRKMWLAMKADFEKSKRKTRTSPRQVMVGSKGQKKMFRYVKAPNKIPTGIMSIVHSAIKELKQGSVADVTTEALSGGLDKVTGQDPTNQTSIMLHRMMKTGVVEVL